MRLFSCAFDATLDTAFKVRDNPVPSNFFTAPEDAAVCRARTVCLLFSAASWFALAAPARADNFPWERYAKYPADWYESAEARKIAANVLSHQAALGGWPKNVDTGAEKFAGDPEKLRGTFDNGATLGELRFLARIHKISSDERYRAALEKGLKYILDAQYPTGGWPLYFPPGKTFSRHITFNDDCTVSILRLLRDVTESKEFAFLRKTDREAAKKAFERGIDCIVKCQIIVKGQRTGWCAHHDEKTLEPRPGRSYEPVSIGGAESAAILELLMSLDRPSDGMIRAIHGGCKWLDEVKLSGIKVVEEDGERSVVKDNNAPALWARCHEIGTNRPLFSGRDGVVKYNLSEIEAERRNGHVWYGHWGQAVLKRYAEWKEGNPEK